MGQLLRTGLAQRASSVYVAFHFAEVEDDDNGFFGSVRIPNDGSAPAIRLNKDLRGQPHEGRVRRAISDRLLEGRPGFYEFTASAPRCVPDSPPPCPPVCPVAAR